jgi:transcriptional pleiotropic repressor
MNVSDKIRTLTYTELKFVKALFTHWDESNDTIITTTRVAEAAGVSKAIVVSALRKLEIAGFLTTRSLGMKGTYIRVEDREFLEAVKEL